MCHVHILISLVCSDPPSNETYPTTPGYHPSSGWGVRETAFAGSQILLLRVRSQILASESLGTALFFQKLAVAVQLAEPWLIQRKSLG